MHKILIAIFAMLAITTSAKAQSAQDNRARAQYLAAEASYDRGDYEAALRSEEQAREILGQDNALLAAMRVRIYSRQGWVFSARDALEQFYQYDASPELLREIGQVENNLPAPSATAAFDEAVAANRRADYTLAARAYEFACESGEDHGCFGLAYAYSNGLGVEQNGERSVRLYEPLCDAGNEYACANLGSVYLNGGTMPPNYERAAHFWRRACDGGYSLMCWRAGDLYSNPAHGFYDATLATSLLAQGCELRNSESCEALEAIK
ncbi:tetratricopeptide repeat protein [Aurantiacibacter zhengii]|uniref:Sel1 repeat family protein n=1 Tax=Aurantiacibacter zhengii TaxID=2307003 RepID=A0A418NQE3_9SPHN|nr:tetratricopeptide repeat protein [Aurantiacibacter zhengii]RIV84670.1 sel1 repeat family protein [Aurantiacibacter zhengii]